MSAWQHVAIVLCALSTSACYPIFHDVQDTPIVSGIVTMHGKPVADAMVQLYYNDPVLSDTNRVLAGKADASGRFTIGPIKDFKYFGGLVGYAGTDWRLEFVVGGTHYQGWQNRSLGFPSAMIDVSCELDDPIKSGTLGLRSTGEGFCRIVSERRNDAEN